MLRAWLLPEASYPAAREGWTRPPYQPRHGKPPPIMRAGLAAMAAGAVLGRRFFGDAEDTENARPVGLARAGGIARPGSVAAPGAVVTWAQR
jgi:hypothetical protein